jgi:hypothetical protein
MLNQDINSRFQDWLLNPTEALDFEVKGWLDLADQEARAAIAKALIALENHGGGFLLIGYTKGPDGRLVPEMTRPASLASFNNDEFNGIVKRYAEPPFHVDSALQTHPESGEQFPLVIVRGSSKVPVRADRGSAGNTIRKDFYYTRRPGPSSEPPQSGAEWDALIRRCVSNQREDIVSLLRQFGYAGAMSARPPQDEHDIVAEFATASQDRWAQLNESLPPEHPARISKGYLAMTASLVGTKQQVKASAQDVLSALQNARRYTGWPAFVTLHQEKTSPQLIDGCLQAWLAYTKYPDVGHADFWRICMEGKFFLLRGFQEDALTDRGAPGTLFEASIPIWRVGEFLIRVAEVGSVMFEPGFEVVARCEWIGLKGRKLYVHSGRRYVPPYSTAQDAVVTTGQFSDAAIRDLLPDAVKTLTAPLYEYFEFFQPPPNMYSGELSEMTKGNF